MEFAIAIVAAIVLGAIGLIVGRSGGRSAGLAEGRAEGDARMRSLVEAAQRGQAPKGLVAGSAEADLQAAFEQGWAPREAEREAALREAIGRVSTFLATSVRSPLTGFGANATAPELVERINRALGSLQDLEFFIDEVGTAHEGTDLVALAQGVAREFAADQGVGVRLRLGGGTVRREVNPSASMDALYLVLHNA